MDEISSGAKERWEEYVRLLGLGLRRKALAALDRFLEAMRAESDNTRTTWVLAFCAAPSKEHLRHPLFRDLMFPILRDRFLAGDGHAAYWLAMFVQQIYQSHALRKQIDNLDRLGLCERAVTLEPRHPLARRKLIDTLADAFAFAVHEVPHGVLGFGSMNGASTTQCDDLLERLERLEALVEAEGLQDEFREAIAEWRFQFRSYRSYRLDKEGAASYADYLRMRLP